MAEKLPKQPSGWMGLNGKFYVRRPFDPNLAAERPYDKVSPSALGEVTSVQLSKTVAALQTALIHKSPATTHAERKPAEVVHMKEDAVINPLSEPRELFLDGKRLQLSPFTYGGSEFEVIQREDHEGPVTVTKVDNRLVIDGDKMQNVLLGKKYASSAENPLTFVVSNAHTIILREGHRVHVTGLVGRIIGDNGTVVIEEGASVIGKIPDVLNVERVAKKADLSRTTESQTAKETQSEPLPRGLILVQDGGKALPLVEVMPVLKSDQKGRLVTLTGDTSLSSLAIPDHVGVDASGIPGVDSVHIKTGGSLHRAHHIHQGRIEGWLTSAESAGGLDIDHGRVKVGELRGDTIVSEGSVLTVGNLYGSVFAKGSEKDPTYVSIDSVQRGSVAILKGRINARIGEGHVIVLGNEVTIDGQKVEPGQKIIKKKTVPESGSIVPAAAAKRIDGGALDALAALGVPDAIQHIPVDAQQGVEEFLSNHPVDPAVAARRKGVLSGAVAQLTESVVIGEEVFVKSAASQYEVPSVRTFTDVVEEGETFESEFADKVLAKPGSTVKVNGAGDIHASSTDQENPTQIVVGKDGAANLYVNGSIEIVVDGGVVGRLLPGNSIDSKKIPVVRLRNGARIVNGEHTGRATVIREEA